MLRLLFFGNNTVICRVFDCKLAAISNENARLLKMKWQHMYGVERENNVHKQKRIHLMCICTVYVCMCTYSVIDRGELNESR